MQPLVEARDKRVEVRWSQSPYGANPLQLEKTRAFWRAITESHVSCPLREAPPPRLPGHHARGIDR